MNEKDLSTVKKQSIDAGRSTDAWVAPAVDIFEREDQLTLVADLPGVPMDRLELGIDQGVLTIEAPGPASGGEGALYREFGNIGYRRRFQLSDALDTGRISADFKDGVLTVTLPKAPAARPRRIEVNVH